MKSRKLYPENITKCFRKFNGDVSIQIDGQRWIHLKADEKILNDLLIARNSNRLDYVIIDDNQKILDIQLKKKNLNDKDIINKVREIYRHG